MKRRNRKPKDHKRRKKKGGKGKRKGASFERKICEKLSRWIDPDSDETIFWRSAMSGGRATVRFKRGMKDPNQAGDLACVHPKGRWLTQRFAVEMKFYKKLDIQSALVFGKGKLVKFWKQAYRQARDHGKKPILIAKENNTPVLVLFSDQSYETLAGFGYKAPIRARTNAIWKRPAIVCLFEEVFKHE